MNYEISMIVKDKPFAELTSYDGKQKIRIYVISRESNHEDWYMNFIQINMNGINAHIQDPAIMGTELQMFKDEIDEMLRGDSKEASTGFAEPILNIFFEQTEESNLFFVEGGLMSVKFGKLNDVQKHSKGELKFEFYTKTENIRRFSTSIGEILVKYPPII